MELVVNDVTLSESMQRSAELLAVVTQFTDTAEIALLSLSLSSTSEMNSPEK